MSRPANPATDRPIARDDDASGARPERLLLALAGDEGKRLPLRVASGSPPAVASGTTLAARFGDLATLELIRLESGAVSPGGTLSGILGFRALGPSDADYRVSIQLVGERGLTAQQDGPPAGGASPTSGWLAGDWIEHPFALTVPADAPTGRYRLIAVLYDGKSGARLPVGKDDFATVGEIEVR